MNAWSPGCCNGGHSEAKVPSNTFFFVRGHILQWETLLLHKSFWKGAGNRERIIQLGSPFLSLNSKGGYKGKDYYVYRTCVALRKCRNSEREWKTGRRREWWEFKEVDQRKCAEIWGGWKCHKSAPNWQVLVEGTHPEANMTLGFDKPNGWEGQKTHNNIPC